MRGEGLGEMATCTGDMQLVSLVTLQNTTPTSTGLLAVPDSITLS